MTIVATYRCSFYELDDDMDDELASAAYARSARGDADSALALLARAVRTSPQMVPTFMRSPRYASLRRDPAFGLAMQGIPPSEVRGR